MGVRCLYRLGNHKDIGVIAGACVSCRVSARTILPLYREAKQLQDKFDSFDIQHVYRCVDSVERCTGRTGWVQ